MGQVCDSIVETIGRTPLVRLGRLARDLPGEVVAKMEGFNPLSSVKDRIARAMIDAAERDGLVRRDTVIIEPTSGNTGIGLAFVCAARGYRLTVTMPESMSIERRSLLQALGAEVLLTPAAEGMSGAIRRADEILRSAPAAYFMPQQFKNPANPEIHRRTTAEEIWNDTEGRIDILVSGVGTGGTITGVSRHVKGEQGRKMLSVAVEPTHSPVITQKRAGQDLRPGPHKIQGIGAGFIPDTLDMTQVDRVEQVTNEESIEMARRLSREEGILSGISCGAAAAVSLTRTAVSAESGCCGAKRCESPGSRRPAAHHSFSLTGISSILAATMKSFSERPPIACVVSSIATFR